jgi:hypothetical protein
VNFDINFNVNYSSYFGCNIAIFGEIGKIIKMVCTEQMRQAARATDRGVKSAET